MSAHFSNLLVQRAPRATLLRSVREREADATYHRAMSDLAREKRRALPADQRAEADRLLAEISLHGCYADAAFARMGGDEDLARECDQQAGVWRREIERASR
jgi:hypothetical protein